MMAQSLYHSFQRYRTLRTHRVSSLPIVILMPHSACNCRCVMCDIWKDNKNLRQLSEDHISGLLGTLKDLGTKQVVMSGGEALLNPNFFRLCRMLRKQDLHITLLSTGLTLQRHAEGIVDLVNDVIVSLDGDRATHDRIRNIGGAYDKLSEGVDAIRRIRPGYRITARTVIHRLNYGVWPGIIDGARNMGLDSISFLPADVSSHAFNREVLWSPERQSEVLPSPDELPALKSMIVHLTVHYRQAFEERFILESPEKIARIHQYYCAVHGAAAFPYKKCNAPWVSTVIEADGTVRPCFFHNAIGNINQHGLMQILNGEAGLNFRRSLDTDQDDTCRRCVCYLNLPISANPLKS